MLRIVEQAQALIAHVVGEGDIVVDATVGNGHDTLFLARCAGESGKVFGFDVQQEALDRARRRLESTGMLSRVELIHAGHEQMTKCLARREVSMVRAVMFNLGYLPGGDRDTVTRPVTTLVALQAAFDLLSPGGLLTVVIYSGHEAGQEESEAVRQWASRLPPEDATVLYSCLLNTRRPAPSLLAVERREPSHRNRIQPGNQSESQ